MVSKRQTPRHGPRRSPGRERRRQAEIGEYTFDRRRIPDHRQDPTSSAASAPQDIHEEHPRQKCRPWNPRASPALAFGPCLLRFPTAAGVRHSLGFWRRWLRHDLVAARSRGPMAEEERRIFTHALYVTRGDVCRAAELLKIGRTTLQRKVKLPLNDAG